LSIIFLSSL